MQKTWKRMFTSLLALVMVLSCVGLPAMAAPEAPASAEYEIYPTPHQVVYNDGTTALTAEVNVVYGNVDKYTKAKVQEVLDIKGLTAQLSDAVVPGKLNVLVGIYNSGDAADAYVAGLNLAAAEHYGKYDAHVVDIRDNVIAIVGRDTDAAFRGVTTLKHIFNQVGEDLTVRTLTILDYADVKGRGFIEGYYGNPWSTEDRAELMKFGGDYKLNNYIYAPKDDPKHNRQWKALYTEEELADIAMLAEAGNKSKCYYVYALHTFMYDPVDFGAGYEADLQIIKDKFTQLMDAGVKQFAILADDAGVPMGGSNSYIRLMTDLTEWLKTQTDKYEGLKTDMIFCPNDYMGWGNSYQMQGLKAMPASVSLIQTGGKVWGEVGPNFNDSFYNNMGRPAYMWINWPCSDNTKNGLIMGGAEMVLKPNVRPETVDGIVLNPMQQSEPSKAGLFTNADYAWNIWKEASHYEKVWADSFKYVDHGTAEDTVASAALRELSKHMLNSAKLYNEESFELKGPMKQLTDDLSAGNEIAAQAQVMRQEFVKLQKAAKDYRAQAGNTRVRDQIVYWLDCWDDTTTAVINFLDAAVALENNENLSVIWDYYAAGQAAAESSRTHGFHYIDHTEYAMVGRLHVTPFMNKLDSLLATRIGVMVDPSKQVVTYISNRPDVPEGSLNYVTDNNPATEIIYKNPSHVDAGTYVGLTYASPVDIQSVTFRMGQKNNPADTFAAGKLEYTTDGKTWQDVDGQEYNQPADVTAQVNLKGVKGIRMICTRYTDNKWLGIRDIVVELAGEDGNEGGSTEAPTASVVLNNVSIRQGSEAGIIDNDMNSYGWMAEKNYKDPNDGYDDFIPVDAGVTVVYDRPVTLKTIHMKQDGGSDKLTGYAIEYSADGETDWQTLQTYTGEAEITLEVPTGTVAKAIRIRNTELHLSNDTNGYWWKLYDFSATLDLNTVPGSKKGVYTNVPGAPVLAELGVSEFHLTASEAITLPEDGYVGLDLGRIRDLNTITVTGAENAILEVSKNGVDWTVVTDSELGDARYVRVINKGFSPKTFTLGEFTVTTNELTAPSLKESNIGINNSWGVAEDCRDNGAAFDGNVETITEFADFPQKGQFIIYDLGQMRNISKLELYAQDSAVNYIRDAAVSISADGINWTPVFNIGDGVENVDDGGVTCIDSDAGYTASSKYPNKVSISGTVEAQPARYIKIEMTASNFSRAVVFNEIVINDGEYVPTSNNPTFHSTAVEKQGHPAENMLDGDLTTTFVPNTTEAGSLTYTLSDNLNINRINLIQKNISNAKLSLLVQRGDRREWIDAGILDHSLNAIEVNADLVLEMKVEWTAGNAPAISEIITFRDEKLSYINVFGVNMNLGNTLAMQFMIEKKNVEDPTGLTLKITKTFADGRDDVVIEVPASQWENYGNRFYSVKFTDLSAKEMTDTITAVILKDGQPAGGVYEDTVEAYTLRLLRGDRDDAYLDAVLVDMLNYGAEAQKHFKYNLENLANAKLTAEELAKGSDVLTAENVQVKGDKYYGTNMNLGNSMALTLFFKDITPEMRAVVTYRKYNGESKTVDIPGSDFVKYNNTTYGVRVDTLVVGDAGQAVTVTVFDAQGNQVASATDSVASYLGRSTKLGTLGDAILQFANSAVRYFNSFS